MPRFYALLCRARGFSLSSQVLHCKFPALLAGDRVASSLFQWVAEFGQHSGLSKTLLPSTDSQILFSAFFRHFNLGENTRNLHLPPPSTTLVPLTLSFLQLPLNILLFLIFYTISPSAQPLRMLVFAGRCVTP